MTAPGYPQVRQALADTLTRKITGLRGTAYRPLQVNPPQAVILPAQGTLARYSVSMDGETDYLLRVILLVAPADSSAGEETIDPYIGTGGPSSIWAAVQADATLGGVVSSAVVTEAAGYGVMNMTGIDYLSVTFNVTVMV